MLTLSKCSGSMFQACLKVLQTRPKEHAALHTTDMHGVTYVNIKCGQREKGHIPQNFILLFMVDVIVFSSMYDTYVCTFKHTIHSIVVFVLCMCMKWIQENWLNGMCLWHMCMHSI